MFLLCTGRHEYAPSSLSFDMFIYAMPQTRFRSITTDPKKMCVGCLKLQQLHGCNNVCVYFLKKCVNEKYSRGPIMPLIPASTFILYQSSYA